MTTALSFLSAAAEQGVIDRLQSLGEAQKQLADPDYWGSVGIITLTGILVVFLILAVLIFFFWLMGTIFKTINKSKAAKVEKAKAEITAAPAPAPVEAVEEEDDDDDEIIAVISAAIATYSELDGKQYAIKSIKRRDNKARSAWSLAGIGENTRPF